METWIDVRREPGVAITDRQHEDLYGVAIAIGIVDAPARIRSMTDDDLLREILIAASGAGVRSGAGGGRPLGIDDLGVPIAARLVLGARTARGPVELATAIAWCPPLRDAAAGVWHVAVLLDGALMAITLAREGRRYEVVARHAVGPAQGELAVTIDAETPAHALRLYLTRATRREPDAIAVPEPSLARA